MKVLVDLNKPSRQVVSEWAVEAVTNITYAVYADPPDTHKLVVDASETEFDAHPSLTWVDSDISGVDWGNLYYDTADSTVKQIADAPSPEENE